MTIAINFPSSPSRRTQNESRLVVSAPEHGSVSYRFMDNTYVISSSGLLTIKLEADSGQEMHDGSKMHIYSYCCTETDINNFRAVSSRAKKGPIKKIAASSAEQSKPFDPETDEVTFSIALSERQFIFIGIIIAVTRPEKSGKPRYYLCDPQVGNGPPGSSISNYATLL